METWIDTEREYIGKFLSLRVGHVRLGDGSIATREVIEHPGSVAIVPVRGDSLLLVRQFRISIGREIVELPAGRMEAQESPAASARRELEEELGYRARRLVPMTSYYSSVGFTNEILHIFLGFDLEKTQQRPEWDERITLVEVPISEIETRLSNNEFEDSKTLIGLYKAMSYLRTHPEMLGS